MSPLPHAALAVLLSLGVGACAAEEEFAPSDEQADSKEIIELRVPDAPTEIEIDATNTTTTNGQSIAYGHCNPSDEDENVVTIDCPTKWTEVGWFHISSEQSGALLEQGNTNLEFTLAITDSKIPDDSVRFSIHSTDESGAKTKLLSEPNVHHGETLGIPLEASAFDVYVARGENSALIWGTGAIEFHLSTEAN